MYAWMDGVVDSYKEYILSINTCIEFRTPLLKETGINDQCALVLGVKVSISIDRRMDG